MVDEGPVKEFAAQTGALVLACDVVSNRRGSIAWKAETTGGRYVVKAHTGTDAGRDKAAEIEREAAVLQRLTEAGAIDPSYFAAARTGPLGTRWIAARWIDGTSMWAALAPARDTDTPTSRTLLTSITRTLAGALAALHAHGFTHADVQPTNIRVTPTGVGVLLDYALACGPEEHLGRLPYRGALTHTTAPELAAELLATRDTTHVQVLPPADVWALGASLFWCWTGERPIAYRDDVDAGREGMLHDIADGGHLRDIAAVRPWAFPEFEDIVTACLADDPRARPTAPEIAASCGQ